MSLFIGAASVLGESDVVRFGSLRIWADRGLIHIEDSRDNSYECVSVRTELVRLKAISEMLANSRREKNSEDQFDSVNVERHQRMLESMIEVMRKAKTQGMPSDPSAVRDLVRRLPKTVVNPGYGGGL